MTGQQDIITTAQPGTKSLEEWQAHFEREAIIAEAVRLRDRVAELEREIATAREREAGNIAWVHHMDRRMGAARRALFRGDTTLALEWLDGRSARVRKAWGAVRRAIIRHRATEPGDGKGESMETTRHPRDIDNKPRIATINAIADEVERARAKFPGREKLLAALMEEVGELAQAMLQRKPRAELEREARQVACVAIRLLEEGDSDFDAPTWDAEGRPAACDNDAEERKQACTCSNAHRRDEAAAEQFGHKPCHEGECPLYDPRDDDWREAG